MDKFLTDNAVFFADEARTRDLVKHKMPLVGLDGCADRFDPFSLVNDTRYGLFDDRPSAVARTRQGMVEHIIEVFHLFSATFDNRA